MSNKDRLSGKKLIKVEKRQHKASGQKQEDEEWLIVLFQKSDRVWWKICESRGKIGLGRMEKRLWWRLKIGVRR